VIFILFFVKKFRRFLLQPKNWGNFWKLSAFFLVYIRVIFANYLLGYIGLGLFFKTLNPFRQH